MTDTQLPQELNHSFTATIGVKVKGETWSCVEMPESAELFGSRKAVRVDAEIDGLLLENAGFMITGTGGHMISLKAEVCKKLGKTIGDSVTVRVLRRVK